MVCLSETKEAEPALVVAMMPRILSMISVVCLVTVAGATLVGCELLSPPGEGGKQEGLQSFEVHLNSQFDNDRVQVRIDGREVFDERVTTLDVLSLAHILKLERPAGPHLLEVVVAGRTRADTTFYLADPQYIQVWYADPANASVMGHTGIRLEISRERPLYD